MGFLANVFSICQPNFFPRWHSDHDFPILLPNPPADAMCQDLNKQYATNDKTSYSLAALLSQAFVILSHWSSRPPLGHREMMCEGGHWQGLDKLQLDWILLMQETFIKCLLCTTMTPGTRATKVNRNSHCPRGSRFSRGDRHGNKESHYIVRGSTLYIKAQHHGSTEEQRTLPIAMSISSPKFLSVKNCSVNRWG